MSNIKQGMNHSVKHQNPFQFSIQFLIKEQ